MSAPARACGGGGSLPHDVAGIVNRLHWSLMFTQWASSLRRPPTAQQISEHFSVSRATAFRYKAAWEAAVNQYLIEAPTEQQGETA